MLFSFICIDDGTAIYDVKYKTINYACYIIGKSDYEISDTYYRNLQYIIRQAYQDNIYF